ncbi:MAG TPA: HlyD family secretion protein [bacterium]|nr:HlyD family secretion protein [bacterium]
MLKRLFGRMGFSRRQVVRLVLIVGVPLVGLIVGGVIYLTSGRYVSTENAYVKADMASVSADVSGKVVAVNAKQHEQVQPGQVLFRLDDAPYRFALQTAEARLADVQRQIASLSASYEAGQAGLKAADDNVTYLQHEYERRKKLTHSGISTQEQLDAAEHAYRSALLEADAKREDLKKVLAQLGGTPDQPVETYPSYAEAKAQRDQAAWNLERTVVKAPIAGIVGQEPPVVGDYVRAGTPVFALVGAQPWVEANLKETELTHITVGQAATFTVDAFPGYVWHAKVASISPATGAEFSLLPPQNATGNWVKVVQRLPVRLSIDEAPGLPALHSGLSVDVEIDTGRQPALTGALQKALAWTRSAQ